MYLLGGALLWAGLLGAIAGLLSLVKRRRRGAKMLAAGVLMFAAGVYLPIRETRVSVAATRLDEFAPVYQWYEVHEIPVAASRERVDAEIRSVMPDEIRYYRALTWMRRVVSPSTTGVLNPPAGRPILQTFTRSFRLIADEPGREILMGTTAERGTTAVKIGFNFRIEEVDASHCRLITETRVYTRGRHMVRGFAAYWRMIYPGSALIRREWLQAIRRRAETAKPGNLPVSGL
jgi:hypothetical protein